MTLTVPCLKLKSSVWGVNRGVQWIFQIVGEMLWVLIHLGEHFLLVSTTYVFMEK